MLRVLDVMTRDNLVGKDILIVIDVVQEKVQRQDALRNRKLTSPAVLPGAVAVGDLAGFVHFLSPTDGQLLARILVGGGAIQAPLVSTPQGILVQSGDGLLVLLRLN
jgi:outer membrane protein assembly factor BamB